MKYNKISMCLFNKMLFQNLAYAIYVCPILYRECVIDCVVLITAITVKVLSSASNIDDLFNGGRVYVI